MIPKIIHYCWFGRGEKPNLVTKCISSWKSFLPDYIIKEWNEDNFDVFINPYSKEAYEEKKYAFVSDYARFEILYSEGGIYLDTDVELIKKIDDLLCNVAFTGFENDFLVAPGLILGSEKGNLYLKEMIIEYQNCHFVKQDGTYNTETVVTRFTKKLLKEGLILNGEYQILKQLTVYPSEYFSPKSFETGLINITSNTYSIHHYAGSWIPIYQKVERKIWSMLNLPNYQIINRLRNLVLKEMNSILFNY